MKRLYILICVAMASWNLSAQDSYTNTAMTSSQDLIGTARYVGMGGAMGALGADISVISDNPAGIGLMRKNDISLTAGGLWYSQNTSSLQSGSHGTFDQAGIVTSINVGGERVKYLNLSFNYRKKVNFNQAFDCGVLTGASMATQLATMANGLGEGLGLQDEWAGKDFSLYGAAYRGFMFDYNDITGLYNTDAYRTSGNATRFQRSGNANSFDINLSTNIDDRYYVGITFGIENMHFDQRTLYSEYRTSNYGLNNSIIDESFDFQNVESVRGYGFNVKVGTIIRPFDSSSFRVGMTIETPTWYRLNYENLQTVYSHWDLEGYYIPNKWQPYDSGTDNYLEYNLQTPWKFRLSAGSTIGGKLAWGIGYEYAMYQNTKMSYPTRYFNDTYRNYYYDFGPDYGMNDITRRNMKDQHTFKAGVEYRATKNLSLRAGYNFISSPYTQTSYMDPGESTTALLYPTSLQYTNLSDVNIVTFGLGYTIGKFYIDMAYKWRGQSGDHYAFVSEYSNDSAGKPISMPASHINLNRNQIVATIGLKF